MIKGNSGIPRIEPSVQRTALKSLKEAYSRERIGREQRGHGDIESGADVVNRRTLYSWSFELSDV